ncbi:MAG: hypothetical protein K5739_01575 [Lachnospiraceae bacterium]|nr:hypothetical protein [Lachnospiraceae bacterium]
MEQKEFEAGLQKALDLARRNHNTLQLSQIEEIFGDVAGDEKHREILLAYFKAKEVTVYSGEDEKDEILAAKAVEEEFSFDPADRDYIKQYREELEAIVPLSKDALGIRIRDAVAGDKAAGGQVLEQFLPMAADLARTYAGQGPCMEDLIGEANLALTEAVLSMESYLDETLPIEELHSQAESFFGTRMMDALEEMVRGHMSVKEEDEKMADMVNQVAEAATSLSEELGRKVTVSELSENTGIDNESIRTVMQILGKEKGAIDIQPEDE